MSTISFQKYQGAGNDFVMIDGRQQTAPDPSDQQLIAKMCDRKFGIGADGLIILKDHAEFDFEMLYFNADGFPGSMCGNGGRCVVAFAHALGIINQKTTFLAVDGPHEAKVVRPSWIELEMIEVADVEIGETFYYMDTGSPHYVRFVSDLDKTDVFAEGSAIRYSDRFKAVGTNVNFVQSFSDRIAVATYERGVENETLACGTGVTAAAIAHYLRQPSADRLSIDIEARGGTLQVRFKVKDGHHFSDIWLCGPAEKVYQGHWS